MARGRFDLVTTLVLALPLGAGVLLAAQRAEAATPTYYNNLGAFQADITDTVTDDYSNPGYVFNQSNAAMSAVLGETDYESTGHDNINLVSDGVYCAGCNGSFELSFQTTTVGNADGVHGVGMNVVFHDLALPYYAYITFADGTTANIQMPALGSFWGVSAPERIERIHIGLSMGATTTDGAFGIDNLVIGEGDLGGCMMDADCMDDGDACTSETCVGGGCQTSPVSCDDEDACTDDSCDPEVGCMATPNTEPCDDADACTLNDACFEGSCGGEPMDCDDADACTVDACDPRRGTCSHAEQPDCCVEASDCPDGSTCTDGTCVAEPGASTGGVDETDAGIDDSGDATDGTAGGLDTGPASTGADSGSGFDQDAKPDFSVCSCTTTPPPEQRLWWSMVLIGLVLRRRRRAA